jgi:arylsulfatase A-like enzyme
MKIASALVGLLALALSGCGGGDDNAATSKTPNILLVIMDDVSIDQMQVFGYGGKTPPSTPNIEQIAGAGIRFHNTWAMPACTTSRAVIFDARFPLRTNVLGALGPNDLANSMVSPFEMTTPKLLAQRGYDNALFGKFHLALQGHDPAGYAMPYNLGWNYFAGWLDETGDPSSIDKTAGASATGGADSGACYMADGSCRELTSSGPVPPGRTCLDRGGILDPNETCQMPPPDYLNFTTLNSHYVSPLVFNYPNGSVEQVPPSDLRARRFRATVAVDEAMAWINNRPRDRPWMATVSFASDHTPQVQPPVDEAQSGNVESSNLDCSETAAQRVLSNLMIESIDAEVGRLLVETGIAQRGGDGRLIYQPGRSDTMVIIVGDNGSLGSTVKEPFDTSRAKGTAYQTGVWVPLIVAGPLVREPDRVVSNMVNIADLYALFGEIAGIEDVQRAVPRPIDAVPMLPMWSTRIRVASARGTSPRSGSTCRPVAPSTPRARSNRAARRSQSPRASARTTTAPGGAGATTRRSPRAPRKRASSTAVR